jgi:predicted ATPase/DNA-binding SARP family transcriptional activator
MNDPWRIQMLGGLRAVFEDTVITRFRTRKTACLLAYLALHMDRVHPRETLVDLFWPEAEIDSGRHNLRLALSSLRHQFEPPGVPSGAILISDRSIVKLNPAAVLTDVQEFNASITKAQSSRDGETIAPLMRAVELYAGDLLPGFYEDWIFPEQSALREQFCAAHDRLTVALADQGEMDLAIANARRGVAIDPLREEAHARLIELLVAAGRPKDAREQLMALERILRDELGESPTPETRGLLEVTQGARARAQRVSPPQSGKRKRSIPRPAQPTDSPWRKPRLPLQFTRFIGREQELARLQVMLLPENAISKGQRPRSGGRLVTLTGPGGSGKTRLAVEVAGLVAEAYNGSAWFVPLADASRPEQIATSICRQMGLEEDSQQELFLKINTAAGGAPILLILDNLEQLIDSGGECKDASAVILELMQSCQSLTCLVTSRQRLKLPFEQVFYVAPLPIPSSDEANLVRLLETPSVRLFVERARAVRVDFALTPGNGTAVTALCRALDGIPLAIELAAARSDHYSPAQMLARIPSDPSLLSSRLRIAEERHRSVDTAIEWSCGQLGAETRNLFAGLSVFRGGWTVEAVEQVCGVKNGLNRLIGLYDNSLIQAEPDDCGPRFSLLETVRQYAERLITPEELESLERAHAQYFLGLVERERPSFWGDSPMSFPKLEIESANIAAALSRSHAMAEPNRSRMIAGLAPYWYRHGYLHEGTQRILAQLALGDSECPANARAILHLGVATIANAGVGEHRRVFHHARAAYKLFRSNDDPRGQGYALRLAGIAAFERGKRSVTRRTLERALEMMRCAEDRYGQAMVWNALGYIHMHLAEFDTALPCFNSSLSLLRQLNHPDRATPLCNLGSIALWTNDLSSAHRYYSESLRIRVEMGDRRGIAFGHQYMGDLFRVQGDHTEAKRRYVLSLKSWRDLHAREGAGKALLGFALSEAHRKPSVLAAHLLGAAMNALGTKATPAGPFQLKEKNAAAPALIKSLGEARYEAAYSHGLGMAWEDALDAALAV